MKKGKGYQLKEMEHFDKLAEEMGEIWWGSTTPAGIKRLQRRTSLFAQQLSHFKDPLVLEIGCGTGAFSKFILEEIPHLRLTGFDISPKCIQIAKERFNNYKNVHFEVADVSNMQIASETFDAVIGNSILHHLPVEEALGECFRVLKPGGIICFSEPNMMNPQIALEKNIRFIGKMLQNTEDETAFFRWQLASILKKVGFKNVSVKPFDFLHPIVPTPLIKTIDTIGKLFEKLPLLKEISGSLLIYASKFD
jgi:ubiquinone/menaquinone biosynthesis C-methylase UbiE